MPIFVAGVFYYIFNFVVAFVMSKIEKKLSDFGGSIQEDNSKAFAAAMSFFAENNGGKIKEAEGIAKYLLLPITFCSLSAILLLQEPRQQTNLCIRF